MANSLFNNEFKNLNRQDILELFTGNEIIKVNNNQNIMDLLIQIKACTSKRESKEFILGNAISINGEKITDINYQIDDKDFLDSTYIIVKRGKKNYYLGEKNNE